jgi:hypothetical protein
MENSPAREKFELFCPAKKIVSFFMLKFINKKINQNNQNKKSKFKTKTKTTPKTRYVLPTQSQSQIEHLDYRL